jgi:hypothetical protein
MRKGRTIPLSWDFSVKGLLKTGDGQVSLPQRSICTCTIQQSRTGEQRGTTKVLKQC